ncbi:hypothetical protein DER44DRAFT_805599 [Fusarium oxysporum]|nr:hypothetical protein DER44DRAFT_805599 [Fusarium oxysporum]
MANQNRVIYTVDPSTNPASWPPGQAPEFGTAIYRVDVTYINLNRDSDFRTLRTGTNSLYRIVSMNVGEYQCIVVMETEKSTDDLMSHGFPWDRNADPQSNVILE